MAAPRCRSEQTVIPQHRSQAALYRVSASEGQGGPCGLSFKGPQSAVMG